MAIGTLSTLGIVDCLVCGIHGVSISNVLHILGILFGERRGHYFIQRGPAKDRL